MHGLFCKILSSMISHTLALPSCWVRLLLMISLRKIWWALLSKTIFQTLHCIFLFSWMSCRSFTKVIFFGKDVTLPCDLLCGNLRVIDTYMSSLFHQVFADINCCRFSEKKKLVKRYVLRSPCDWSIGKASQNLERKKKEFHDSSSKSETNSSNMLNLLSAKIIKKISLLSNGLSLMQWLSFFLPTIVLRQQKTWFKK